MTHRERVFTALNHQVPDRCPMQISFTPEFSARLKKGLDIKDVDVHNPHGGGNTYILERTLDEDMLLTSVGWANSYYATDQLSVDGKTYTDEWGVTWSNVDYDTRFGKGRYTEIVQNPLADESVLDSYVPPDPDRDELYIDAQRILQEFKKEYWIVGVTVCTVFETAWALRGYERMLMDLTVNEDLAQRIFEIPFDYHLAAAKHLVEMGVDMIWIGDDVGAQHNMIMSPDTWRRLLKPLMETFIATLKEVNPKLKVAYHSDGWIMSIIPDLIEIGLDVLNPIQPLCMPPDELKKSYGGNLCFWGSIDEQHTLPFGSRQDVEKEVLTRLDTLGKGGGLIIGPTHHVQLDTPLENFWAMVNTVRNTACQT